MKRIMLCAGIAVLMAAVSQAQETPDSTQHRKDRMMREHHRGETFKNLNLTEEQKSQFKALNEENRKQMEELRKNDNITVKEWKSKMETLRKDHRAKVQGLLTTEQKSQLEKSRQERRSKMEGRRGSRAGNDRAEKMKETLGLTEEQSAKLKDSRNVMREKMKVIREDQALSEDAKKEKSKQLIQDHKESIRSILTEEQLKKLDEQKQKRNSKRKIV